MPQASSLAAEIKAKIGVDVELIRGGGGVFDVVVDDKLIYSKQNSDNQFPQEQALVEQLKEMKG